MKKTYSFLAILVAMFLISGTSFSQDNARDNSTHVSKTIPNYTLNFGRQDFPHLIDAAVLYNNGPIINTTHTIGGNAVSVLRAPLTTYGAGHALSALIRVADDFIVPPGGWKIDSIYFYAYQTGSTLTSTMTSVNFAIWNGVPGAPGSAIVFGDTSTNRMVRTTFAGIYRNTTGDTNGTTRPVMLDVVGLGAGVTLAAGTYWIDWQTGGTLASGPWVPPVSITGQTTTGNSRQKIAGAWADLTDGGTLTGQGLPFILHGSVPPPPSTSTLIITNDTTTPTAQRIADRDTLKRYVGQLIGGNVTYMTKNITTVFPDLSGYNTIILQESSFDATTVRSLVAAQRQALKDWLVGGSPGNKRSLMMIGADLGYAYDQAAVAQLDTVFSRTYGGFQFITDNSAPAGFAGVALNPPGTSFDALNTAATSYWPDGCRPISGGVPFNRYLNRVPTDTTAGIYKIGAGWNVVSTFQDPHYFTGLGDGPGDVGFKRVLKNMLAIVRTNGGIITGVTPTISTIADKFELSQNYPNPFNPTTKINFAIPTSGFVSLKVYDIAGKQVMTLVNNNMTVGSYTVDFNGSYLSSGVYFYRLESNNFVETKKMMLVK